MNPEFYFVTFSYKIENMFFNFEDACNDPAAHYICSFDANGDKVRTFEYDIETRTYKG